MPATDRLAVLLATLRVLVARVALLAWASAGSAALVGVVLYGALGARPGAALVAAVTAGLLLLPALGTFLGVAIVRSVLALPEALRLGERLGPEGGTPVQARLLGFVPLLFRVRAMVRAARATAGRAAALGRVLRLGSLPLVLLAAAAFVLNFVVIGLAIFAVIAAAARMLLV